MSRETYFEEVIAIEQARNVNMWKSNKTLECSNKKYLIIFWSNIYM